MIDFINCPCSGVTLDKLIQPAILAVLASEPSHGYRIAGESARCPASVGVKPEFRESIGSSRAWSPRGW